MANRWTVGEWISGTMLGFLLAAELLFFHSFLILDGYFRDILWLSVGAFLGGPIFCLLLCRIKKPHGAFRFFLLLGFAYAMAGRWELLIFYGIFGFIGEHMLGKSPWDAPAKRQKLWTVFSACYGLLPIVALWMGKGRYLSYLQGAEPDHFFRWGAHFLGWIGFVLLPPVFGNLGCRLGEALLQKHFRKAGAV